MCSFPTSQSKRQTHTSFCSIQYKIRAIGISGKNARKPPPLFDKNFKTPGPNNRPPNQGTTSIFALLFAIKEKFSMRF